MSAARRTMEQHRERKDAARRAKAMDVIQHAITEQIAVPPPVVEVRLSRTGTKPKLAVEALELARQVYYYSFGSLPDCARAIVAAGLADTANVDQVRERLRTWWQREKWPRRSHMAMIRLRDVAADGGLYRSERRCSGLTTGSGPAPKGGKCQHSALPDSGFCQQHDPRPEYVQARQRQAELLRKARQRNLVPVRPFQEWLQFMREELLAEARARGDRLDPKQQGWKLLAEYLDVDQSLISRIARGIHNGARQRAGAGISKQIRAVTVVAYLDGTDWTFQAIYGFDPPPPRGEHDVCPRCHGYKNPEAKVCRGCHDASRVECRYVNTHGEPCDVSTGHDSGYCNKHRRLIARQDERRRHPRPRTGRPSAISVPMLILATGEYVTCPNLLWVSERMWSCNAAGCRDVYAHRKSFTDSLVKAFRKRGWTRAFSGSQPAIPVEESLRRVRAAHEQLVGAHGSVPWPQTDTPTPMTAAEIPFEPFQLWLQERYLELSAGRRGGYSKLAERLRMNPDNLSKWIRGDTTQRTIRRATVDHALERWGDGTTFEQLYRRRPA